MCRFLKVVKLSTFQFFLKFSDTILGKQYFRSGDITGYPKGHGGCKDKFGALRGYILNEEDLLMVKNIPMAQRQGKQSAM